MTDYYTRGLSGERLRHCYDIAPPPIRRYLTGEIDFIRSRLRKSDRLLELGCGYGRILQPLMNSLAEAVGVDVAVESLRLGRSWALSQGRCHFIAMDALGLGFADDLFDVTICMQNGICAFNVDQRALLVEALRVTRPGGTLIVSTYTDSIWPDRLAWFEAQSKAGLIGPLDYSACHDGTIVCTDGFRSGRLTANDIEALCDGLNLSYRLHEISGAALVCVITG